MFNGKLRPRGKRFIQLLFITPVLLLIELAVGFGVFSQIQTIKKFEDTQARLELYLKTNSKYISRGETALRGYMLTNEASYRESFKSNMEELKKNDDYFDSLPADLKSRKVEDINKVSAQKVAAMESTETLYEHNNKDSALAIMKSGIGAVLLDSIRAASTSIRDGITGHIAKERARESNLFVLFFGLIAVLLVFNLFIIWYAYRQFKAYTTNLETLISSLRAANLKMQNFSYMSYHELKTPLRGISGFAHLLKRRFEGNGDSVEAEYAEFITESIKQMDLTINNMRKKYLENSPDEPVEPEIAEPVKELV